MLTLSSFQKGFIITSRNMQICQIKDKRLPETSEQSLMLTCTYLLLAMLTCFGVKLMLYNFYATLSRCPKALTLNNNYKNIIFITHYNAFIKPRCACGISSASNTIYSLPCLSYCVTGNLESIARQGTQWTGCWSIARAQSHPCLHTRDNSKMIISLRCMCLN